MEQVKTLLGLTLVKHTIAAFSLCQCLHSFSLSLGIEVFKVLCAESLTISYVIAFSY